MATTTRFELVTPSKTLFSGAAEMVVCRTVDGEIAFLANHMPYIGALDTCVVRVISPAPGAEAGTDPATGEPEVRVAVKGGFVEVKSNQVIMLADVAELASEVDVDSARAEETQLSAATPGAEDGGEGEVDAALKWAQARLEAAQAV
jgi:F-type H+-transporting ATPase subunit epsilon